MIHMHPMYPYPYLGMGYTGTPKGLYPRYTGYVPEYTEYTARGDAA